MSEYIEPTQAEFQSAQQTALDVLQVNAPNTITKAGSVIRELVVRPLAYLLSWATSNIQENVTKTSVSYLKTSQLTENESADLVASNYFVTRNTGTYSKGVVTLTLTAPMLRIASGSLFQVGDVTARTQKQYIITNSSVSDALDDVQYITSVAYGDYYIANVPVQATQTGPIEVPQGTQTTAQFACSILVQAQLTSALTGGSGTETDAELMQRAQYNTAQSGIGTYYGIKKKLNKAPVSVKGMSVVAGEDVPIFRARYNSVNINPGGFVDCYVKTANQPSTGTAVVTFTKSGQNYTGTMYGGDLAGFYSVDSILVNGAYISDFQVSFGTSSSTNNSDGARLSVDQTATLSFLASAVSGGGDTVDGTVQVTYMPNIRTLQQYVNQDTQKFIGQDIQIKAAIPACVSLTCAVHSDEQLSQSELATLKQAIADSINSTQVGTKTLNFSNIRKACASVLSSADLRLPCTMSCSMFLKDGSRDTFHSTSGILDISDNANLSYWQHHMCFFSISTTNIRIEAV